MMEPLQGSVEVRHETHSKYVAAEILSLAPIRKKGIKVFVEVYDGKRTIPVVTMYHNLKVGQKVILAPEGSFVSGSKVERKKECGEWSEGIICGPLELGCTDEASFCSCISLDSSHKAGDIVPTLPLTFMEQPSTAQPQQAEKPEKMEKQATNTEKVDQTEDQGGKPVAGILPVPAGLRQSLQEDQRKPVEDHAIAGDGQGHRFVGEWDAEGVFFYQAFSETIADWALEHQQLGGPDFNPSRMTWIKPSFAWMLYRAGYGHKDRNQARILKVKLSHDAVAEILSRCQQGHGAGGSDGRVQWDPARSLLHGEGHSDWQRVIRKEPARAGGKAIQIGMRGDLSRYYVAQAITITDVTSLAHSVQNAHSLSAQDSVSTIQQLLASGHLPNERPYVPHCSQDVLSRLRLCSKLH